VTAIVPKRRGGDLRLDLSGRDLFEEPRDEVTGVVDQHVDPAEALDGRGHCGGGLLGVCDVQAHNEQIVVRADGFRDGFSVAPGSHDVVTSCQRSRGELDAQAAARAGDEPRSFVHEQVASKDCCKYVLGAVRATA